MNRKFYTLCMLSLLTVLAACGGKADESKDDGAAAATPKAAAAKPDLNVSEVVGIGRVEPEGEIIPLAANDAGVVTKVFAKEGSVVKAGDPLLELDHRILDAQLEQARRRLTTQAARIRTDEKSLQEAQLQLAYTKTNVSRTQNLVRGGAETGQNLTDQVHEQVLQENAIERWKSVIETDRAQLRELEGDINVMLQELENKSVRAPLDGRLLTVKALPGSFVSTQTSFADFAPTGKSIVRVEIDEMYASKIQPNQPATVLEMGTNRELAKGHVIYAADFLKRKSLFSELAGEMEDRRVREVHVLIDSGETLLFNSRVECRISVANSPQN